MATTAIDLVIEASRSAATLKEIKQATKDIKAAMLQLGEEGGADFDRLAAAGAELKDRIGEVNERIDAMNPDKFGALDTTARIGAAGIQVVTGAMALFGNQSEDTQKALMKVQAAMAFGQGISQLRGLQDEFKKLWAIITANPLTAIVAAFAILATAAYQIYKAFTETSDATKELNKQYEKQKEITSALVTQYDREIEILSAQVGKEHEVFLAKKKKIEAQILEAESSLKLHQSKIQDIKDNDSLYESYLKVAAGIERKLGLSEDAEKIDKVIQINKAERAKEDIEQAKADIKQIGDLKAQLTALTITEDNRQAASGKKVAEERKKYANELQDQLDKEQQSIVDLMNAENQYLDNKRTAYQKTIDDINAKRQADLDLQKRLLDAGLINEEEYKKETANINAKYDDELDAEKNKRYEKQLKDHSDYVAAKHAQEDEMHKRSIEAERKEAALKKQVQQASLQTLSNLLGAAADLAEGHAEAQKGLLAAQATIDTFLAAQKSYTSLAGIPVVGPALGAAAAAAAVIAGIARVKKILSTNMKNPSVGSVSDAGGNANPIGSMSLINTEPGGSQPSTQLDENGNVVSQNANQNANLHRVYVVESDMTSTQNRVSVLENSVQFM